MKAVRTSLMVALVALIAAGCGSRAANGTDGAGGQAASDSIGSPAGATDMVSGVSCVDLGMPAEVPVSPSPTQDPVPLPAGFVPVAATRCVAEFEVVPGDGVWLTKLQQRAAGDLAGVVAELRRPDGTAPQGTACTMIGYLPTIVTLVDAAGTTVVPTIPHDGCGAPLTSVLQAIIQLDWQTEQRTRIRRTQSELEVTSGCGGGYKPVVALTSAERGGPAPVIGPVFLATPAALRVCRYDLSPDEAVDAAGQPFPVGVLANAGTVDGAALAAFVQALTTAPAARACDQPSAPFAVVSPPEDQGRSVVVELGGCYRFLDPAGALRQLDAAAVAALRT
jgi:hypothetical protein